MTNIHINSKITKLISKGVTIHNPISIEIGQDVKISNISSNKVIIYPNCKILGKSTIISSGVELGYESPVTIKNCKLANNVKLKGGYFENSIFLDEVIAGSGCQVRSHSILEEYVNVAHTIGLKSTILFPFIKIGSLVNFCDCFMAGGYSIKNHSEVGSSYTHFNYTPNQDKATPSLIGNVSNGVMLNQNPIFLGGQGGIIGPCRIAYGNVIASGIIQKKNQLNPNYLSCKIKNISQNKKFKFGLYYNIRKKALNNIIFIANLMALMVWYKNIRMLFVNNKFNMLIFNSLINTLEVIIKKRIEKFKEFCKKLKYPYSFQLNIHKKKNNPIIEEQKKELYTNKNLLDNLVDSYLNKINCGFKTDFSFVSSFSDQISIHGPKYVNVILNLNNNDKTLGTLWLNKIINDVINNFLTIFPSLK